MKNWILLTLGLTLCLLACRSSEVQFPEGTSLEVQKVLTKSFISAGGLQNFRNIDSVIYQKRTKLYLKDGSLESEVDQHHAYDLFPSVSGTITWEDSIGRHKIIYSDQEAYRSLNGRKIENSSASATQSFFSNYFVLFIPFKLLDTGTTLSYEGEKEMENGQSAQIIKAIYNPDEFDNHSTSDEWYFFVDKVNGKIVGNLVYHEPTYAFIENIRTTDEYPLRMNLYRKTWRTDKDLNKEYLRGEFWYTDYTFTKVTE